MSETVAILGGTGAEGRGLALRWAKAGLRLRIGSRDEARAREAAAAVRAATRVGEERVQGLANAPAAAEADIVVLTVPLSAQIATIKAVREHLRPGAIVVDATVPVGAALGDRIAHIVTPWAGSAAQQARAFLPESVRLVSAFHSLSAVALAGLEHAVECDVLVCGDDAAARETVRRLAACIAGVRAIDGGPLANSRFSEHIAALLISLNARYKVKHSGVRFTGIDPER